jgi:D-alanyl-D-alanine carboxypeptidase/D-alanyl-D-alanine-endopeptidase (penicillin-binding protein 4)
VNSFLRTGIRNIEGDLLVDDSLFDSIRYDESRESVRVDRAYDAPVGAMSFNWNSVNIFVRPSQVGSQARVFLDPENQYTRLVNKTKTVKGSGQNISVDRDSESKGDVLVVSGSIGAEKNEHVVFKNITKPDLWAGENLKTFLSQRGIKVKGQVKAGRASGKAVLLAESESKPIEQMIADMNKFSNNYVAEMLTKNLAARVSSPATLTKGIELIQAHLLSLGIKKDEMVFVNPSGLTRDNRLSPRSMWKILNHLKNDFQVQPEFLSSLPIAGIDGTLKKRMNGTPAQRWVRAKTGLLTGVTALAGYAGREDGEVFTFVLMHNGSSDESRMRRLFDDWLATLVK